MACLKSPWPENHVPAAVPAEQAWLLPSSERALPISQGSRFQLRKREAGRVPFDRKIGYETRSQTRNERSQSFMQEHCWQCQGQPSDPPSCNYNSLKLFSMGWTVSSWSSALDTYRVPLAPCLQKRSRERVGREKPNEGRTRERENQ